MSSIEARNFEGQEVELAYRFIDKPAGVVATSLLGKKVLELRASPPPEVSAVTSMEKMGLPRITEMVREDFLQWGDLYMDVNNGLPVTQKSMEVLKQANGNFVPTIRSIKQEFTDVESFNSIVLANYKENEEERQREREEKRSIIREAEDQEWIPLEIFDNASTEPERFARYGRYVTAVNIFKRRSMNVSRPVVVRIVVHSSPTNFTLMLRKRGWNAIKNTDKNISPGDNPISEADIELEAKTIGFFDDIFPNMFLRHLDVEEAKQKLDQRKAI